MNRMFVGALAIIVLWSSILRPSSQLVLGQTSLATLVADARYDQGVREYQQRLIAHPRDDQARFALAVLLYFRTNERVGQAFYRHGGDSVTLSRLLNLDLLEIPQNAKPESIDYVKFREYLQSTRTSLEEIIRTTGEISSKELRLPIDMSRIGLDFNQNGQVEENERYSTQGVIALRLKQERAADRDAVLGYLDRIDLLQIRSSCCLTLAAINCALAYDFESMWILVAHRGFAGAARSHDFVNEEVEERIKTNGSQLTARLFGDLTIALHQMRFKLIDGTLLTQAHEQLLLATNAQQERWQLLQSWSAAEENQTLGPATLASSYLTHRFFPSEFTEERRMAMEQMEQILRGRMLLRFWRGKNEERGVNVRRFFLEPPSEFDFIMIAHGAALTPYLELGDCSEHDIWQIAKEVARGFAFIDPLRTR